MLFRSLRVNHRLYGGGWWQRLAGDGQAFVRFDSDPCERRVLVVDLAPESLREAAARTDAAVADMMGRDPRAVVVALRGVS